LPGYCHESMAALVFSPGYLASIQSSITFTRSASQNS
jgi:hypothetical protein